MEVRESETNFAISVGAILGCTLLAASCAASAAAQSNPSSAANPFFGSVTVTPVTDQPLQLSMDDAIRRGLENNLGLKQAENAEKAIHAEQNVALQQFLPTILLTGDTGFYQHNLAAQGFGPGLTSKFGSIFAGGKIPNIPLITKDTLTEGTLRFQEILFSGPVIAGYKAAGAASRAAHFSKMTARGEVVQQVASAYLRAISAASDVENARALEQADLAQLNNAHEQHVAGVTANLDELRARVQYLAQQQARLSAEATSQKALILLKREIGVAPGQQISLTDRAPYSELAVQSLSQLRVTAYKSRQDYQRVLNEQVELKAVHQAYRSQRLPTLSFVSNYGVQQIGGVGSHGTWTAMGNLSFPIFREAALRGDIDASRAQVEAIDAQLADLRSRIDQQLRAAVLDVNAASKLVEVARSNVDLATRALADESQRVSAGVDDTLPLVQAQASLAFAQSNLIQSLYTFNTAKLGLARAAGVLETQYRDYLGR